MVLNNPYFAVPGFGAEKALQRTVCESRPREGGRAGAQEAGRCGGEAADTSGTAGAVVDAGETMIQSM